MEAPFAVLNNTNLNICNTMTGIGSQILLDSLIIDGDTEGVWTNTDNAPVGGTIPFIDFEGLSSDQSYTFTYTTNSATFPCSEQSYDIEIFVEDCDCPGVTVIPPANALCNDATNSFDLNTLLQTTEAGEWAFVNNPGTVNIVNNKMFYTGTVEGTYTLIYTLSQTVPAGCPQSSQAVDFIINEPPNIGKPVFNEIINLCNDTDEYILLSDYIINEDTDGMWLDVSLVPSASFDGVQFNPSMDAPGFYTFEYFLPAAYPCTDQYLSIDFIINESPYVVLIADTFKVCNSDMGIGPVLDLNNIIQDSNNSGLWTDNNNSQAIMINDILNFTGVSPGNLSFFL